MCFSCQEHKLRWLSSLTISQNGPFLYTPASCLKASPGLAQTQLQINSLINGWHCSSFNISFLSKPFLILFWSVLRITFICLYLCNGYSHYSQLLCDSCRVTAVSGWAAKPTSKFCQHLIKCLNTFLGWVINFVSSTEYLDHKFRFMCHYLVSIL